MSTKPKITKKKQRVIKVSDLWCGAGGSFEGMRRAFEKLGYKVEATAANHWDVAVASHSKNHPEVRHLCKAIDSINPLDIFTDRKLDLLWASPECVHHSRARGGKPRDEQKRADAWDVQRWLEKLFVKTLIIENVREFVDWGPLGNDGKPLKSKKGMYFNQFIDFLNILYTVEWRILNCADYGDPTTRERFFLIAKRGKNKRIVFPEPTHASRKVLAKKQPNLFAPEKELKTWVAAREIINWNLEGKNIFGRKKPLSENTMKRIYAGLRKFSGIDIPERELSDDPAEQKRLDGIYQTAPIKIDFSKFNAFTMGAGGATGQQKPRDINEPSRTITGTPTFCLAEPQIEPFLLNQKGTERRMRAIGEPTFTQCSSPNQQYVVQPYMVNLSHTKNNDVAMCKDLETPLPTICGKGMLGVVEPFFISYHSGQKDGGVNRSHGLNEPIPTLDTSNRFGVVEGFIVPCNHGKNDVRANSLDDPMKTITGVDALGFSEPFLVQYFGGQTAVSVDNPVPTITANYEHYAVAKPYFVKYHGNESGAHSIDDPVSTVTTKDRLGLAQPFMIQFYGERKGQTPRTRSVDSPVWTVTPQIRMGIVEPFLVKLEDAEGKELHGLLLLELGCILVVNFRMLHQSELAAAMSFPPGYYFHGTRDQQVKQIGNAVCVLTAEQLVLSALED